MNMTGAPDEDTSTLSVLLYAYITTLEEEEERQLLDQPGDAFQKRVWALKSRSSWLVICV